MNANVESQDLKNAGLKVTLPRLKILEMLEHSPTRHLAAEEIYRRLMDGGDDIGLATVYRVLTQFEAAGLVTRHHDHIVCVKCGRVDEFEDETIERRQHEKAQALGYRLVEHNLIMYGECQRENCPNLKNALRKS
jgi:Fur family transcriptional regulator, ferric uptake regulator